MNDNEYARNDPQGEQIANLIRAALSGQLSRRELIRRGLVLGLGLPAIAAALSACAGRPTQARFAPTTPPAPPATPVLTTPPAPTATPALITPTTSAARPATPATRFAVVGDYGEAGVDAADVAILVASWSPEFVITTGDNNYPSGSADTIDANIGQYYHAFIAPYKGAYGSGSAENRFFPVLGNHDWVVGYPEPYLSYFSLPGNGRYYQLDRGPLSFFMLDSMFDEPDGTAPDSTQGRWLQASMAASTARWKVVVAHHPPFSSGYHGSSDWMQWPFAAWGAQLMLSGHEHSYERIARDGIAYVVNGLGGSDRYAPGPSKVEGSQIFYNQLHGAMLMEADTATLHAQFVTYTGEVVDDFRLT